MANGNNGDDNFDFRGWSKSDMQDVLEQVSRIADDAFDPMCSREDMAQALADILSALTHEDADEDDADSGDEDNDSQD
jgi:hypothetical protein